MIPIRSLAIATVAAAALGLAGCTTHATTGVGYAYPSGYASGYVVYDSAAPYGVEYYPRYPYGGSYAYLVGDRWYVRYGSGWGYLSHEPHTLYNYRVQRYQPYVHSAPPAYRPAPYTAPPAYRPAPYVAPPAYRPAPYTAPPAYRAPPPSFRPAPMPHAAPPPVYRAPPAPRR